jgi:hypothetical protein
MSTIFEGLKRGERTNQSSSAAGVTVEDAASNSPSRSSVGPSRVGNMPASAKTPLNASRARQERRTHKRAGVKLAARVRSADSRNGFEEVLVTVNASRQSLFFITSSEHFRLGMRLRVTFPFNSAHDSVAKAEDEAEVTRMERMPDNRVGVAVQLRAAALATGAATGTAGQSASRGSAGERRHAGRQPFSAAVVIVDSHDSMRLKARCSDLSLGGCYVDTINPFTEGTIAHLELRTADTVFQAVARVTFSHIGMGMGLGFQDLTPEQTAVLANWLGSKDNRRMWVAQPTERVKQAEPAENLKHAEAVDRNEALKLVRQLISKGILTNADLSTLFTEPNPY